MKAINCSDCRKKILKEAREEYLNKEWEIFRDTSRSFAVFAVCGVLTAMARRGRTTAYIKELYDDMCLLFSTPDLFGRTISMTDIMKNLTETYGIDWDKLEVHTQTREAWIHEARKAGKI